ncbi:hypothetical protein ACHQM5_001437 [Ranunculus cassubicifolius]
MAAHFSLLSCLLFSLLTISLSATSQRCHPSDYKVLMQIKKDLGNPYLLASWTPNTDCCEWYCLECNEKTNRVDTLLIQDDDVLSGSIPPAVGDLPYLQTLVFRKLPKLTGTIPNAIAKLKHLSFVRLSWSKLTGPVPDFFSQLPELEYLDLSFNQLTGTIPPSFSKLAKLGALHLDRNNLTGTIPESYGHFVGTVPDLYLSHNHLTGTIPKSFANMHFVRIDLSRNKLVGDASFLFNYGMTEILDISRNMLEFDFSKVKIPVKHVNTLDINHNKIYGSIPKDIAKTVFLSTFNVSYNNLCGKIPTGGRMDHFDESTYIHNKCLCGKPLSVKC